MLKRILLACLFTAAVSCCARAQHGSEVSSQKRLYLYQDSLIKLGRQVVNDESDLQRKNANYAFIRMLVSALRVQGSYSFPFDSLKTVSIINSPDHKFRIFSWPVVNQDGSYRFYGTMQMNSNGPLLMHPLEDYSPAIKNPEDSITTSRCWYGAEYYKIIPVDAAQPYYVLLGWKGNTVKTTKKVIEVLSFAGGQPVWGKPVFEADHKMHDRIVFEYSRQASMLLRYVPEQNLIVFDHLAPPDDRLKNRPDLYGPDLSYDGYRLKNGKWQLVSNLDMRNVAGSNDTAIEDPKKQAARDRAAAAAGRNH